MGDTPNLVPLPEPKKYIGVDDEPDFRYYTADQLRDHAAAVSAAKDARIKVLEDALRMTLASLDGLPHWSNVGPVANVARAALGDKT